MKIAVGTPKEKNENNFLGLLRFKDICGFFVEFELVNDIGLTIGEHPNSIEVSDISIFLSYSPQNFQR